MEQATIVIDPNLIIVALIGAAAGIISAVTTAVVKIVEWRKAKNGLTLRQRILPIVQEALRPTNAMIDSMQIDITRMRLLSLIRNEPTDAENILKVANVYFSNLHGNSEASKLFTVWLKEQNIKCPDWFTYYNNNKEYYAEKQNSREEQA